MSHPAAGHQDDPDLGGSPYINTRSKKLRCWKEKSLIKIFLKLAHILSI